MAHCPASIRPFGPSDLDDLQRIRASAFAPVFQSFRDIVGPAIAKFAFSSADEEQAALLADLCKSESPQEVFVAVVDRRIVGFVSISVDHKQLIGEIGLNAVHPDFSGRGIGTQLCEFALSEMKSAGMKVATVGTGGDPSHAPARRAYEKAGFGPSVPSVWMYRTL